MGSFVPGAVVIVRFPFSDLSASKFRPAIVLAAAGKQEWILCQVTSNPYSDSTALQIRSQDISNGNLRRASFVRPNKLFTASASLIVQQVATLESAAHRTIVDAVITLLTAGLT